MKYDGVGRNDPCPCGAGKKFKKCCGKSGKPRFKAKVIASGGGRLFNQLLDGQAKPVELKEEEKIDFLKRDSASRDGQTS